MQGDEIRAKFLKFFKNKGHLVQPSAPLATEEEGLLFTIAGMVPFKAFFLGEKNPPASRITSCQLCFRTNDLEKVGETSYHHTFFEMLGNFSFGDYFKDEACKWALELVAGEFDIAQNRLWVTIFKEDEQTASIWKKLGFPASKIVRKGEEDNFWSAAEVGPCGPDTEIFFDRGEKMGCLNGCEPGCNKCSRWVEIWNLVFIQYNRDLSGKLSPLPDKNVDTGMGLERMATVLQGVVDDYHTDLFLPLYSWVEEISPASVCDKKALRVISDHLRGLVFLLGEGILPSNAGRGYVVRRVLRRASRYGRRLGLNEPFLYQGVLIVNQMMGKSYPEIEKKQNKCQEIIKREEESFQITLSRGLSILEDEIRDLKSSGKKILSGDTAFRMYDTYGFPLELTQEIAFEAGLKLDEEGFTRCMEEQRRKARLSFVKGIYEEYDPSLIREIEKSSCGGKGAIFAGYEKVSLKGIILAIIKNKKIHEQIEEGEEGELVVSRTPFYPEGGGQISDTGEIVGAKAKGRVLYVQRRGDVILHHIKVLQGEFKRKDEVKMQVDEEKRLSIARSHTSTHLLHAALRSILREDVKQSGSLVDEERLRFDFTYPSPVEKKALKDICLLVNRKIREDLTVEIYEMSLEEAHTLGAIALFEEKYKEKVRVVKVDDFSMEVCGGTHLLRSGQIGLFQIVSESGVAAGIRRIEAFCGEKAFLWLQEKSDKLENITEVISVSEDEIIDKLKEKDKHIADLKNKLDKIQEGFLENRIQEIASQAQNIEGIKVCAGIVQDISSKALRQAAERLKDKLGEAVVALASSDEKKAFIVVASKRKDLPADKLIKELSSLTGGSGGGRWDFAQGGTSHPEKLNEAFKSLAEIVRKMIGKS
ncbi:alanine--tRNA ligase [Candidatus Aerophobetes bacterium]|nr:alanine--tRNA ligase [Candidatus Aerophobetes bacterium]